jgi:peptidoglycan/LPS O-acetylase OafA/YrhL
MPVPTGNNSASGLETRGHVRSLDGLRGVAILMIMVLHFYNEAFMKECYPIVGPILTKLALAGIWGVELFLVLSGYLITQVLLDSKGQQGYFRNFYSKRALRILPLYYVSLLVVFQIVPRVCPLDAVAKELTARQWWLWLFLSNVPGSVPLDGSSLYSLGHFWMLAMQVHFYVLWPLVVLALSQRRLVQVCVGLIIIGVGTRFTVAILGADLGSMLRWSTICRVDGLAVGSILAVLIRDTGSHLWLIRLARHGIWMFGCLSLVIEFIPRSFHHEAVVVFKVPVVVVFLTALLILALRTSKTSILFGLLCSSVLVSFGKYSYGLYVIHGILRPALERLIPLDWLIAMVRIPILAMGLYIFFAITLCSILSFLVWHILERHFLGLKKYCISSPTPFSQ